MEFRWGLALLVLVVIANAQGPKPVNSNYPGLSKVSSYLATKFETDNLVAGAQQATDMILVAALAEKTTADVVSQREAKMPFGGFEIPIANEEYAPGHLYILCGLVEQKSSSYAVTKMNPWPMWQVRINCICFHFTSLKFICLHLHTSLLVESCSAAILEAFILFVTSRLSVKKCH
jgi:hypothetical protein